MVVLVTKRLRFSAAHRLHAPALSEAQNRATYGKCGGDAHHGHDYTLEVTVAGSPDPVTGMVVNVAKLKEIVQERLIRHVDHHCLDRDVPFLAGCVPTMENLVVEFWKVLDGRFAPAQLARIRLFETEDNWAEIAGI